MHRCLAVLEVVGLIFDELGNARGEHGRCPTLANLAHVCKTFHGPAMKSLWREIPGISVIVHLFPPGTFAKRGGFLLLNNRDSMRFQISPEVAACIRRHTMYVKKLRFCENVPRLHYTALAYLNHAPGRPKQLFPRAEEVHLPAFADHPMEAVFYPVLVLGPSVRKVTVVVQQEVFSTYADCGLEAEPEGAQWTALAQRLTELTPNLTSFDILRSGLCDVFENYPPGPVGTIGFKPTLQAFFVSLGSSLQSLDIALLGLSATSMIFLGHLQRLHTLKIGIGHSTRQSFFSVPATTNHLTLSALTDLTIVTNSHETCSKALSLLAIPHLTTLVLEVEMGGAVHPRDLLLPLQQTGSHSRLSSISIYEVKNDYEVDAEQSWWERVMLDGVYSWFEVDDRDLQVLSSFHQLSSLSISPCNTHGVSDEALRSLVMGCPDLRRLHLRDDTMRPRSPTLTFEGVHAALQIAQRMEELTLRFDATTPNLLSSIDTFSSMDLVAESHNGAPDSTYQSSSVGSTQSQASSESHLRSLDVCTSPLSSSCLFKTWLACCHPLVKELHYFKALREGMEAMYDPVTYRDGRSRIRSDKVRLLESQIRAATMFDRWNDVHAFVRETKGEMES
ncbi:hypothetical protein BKA70DRAFT_1565095 [Coprinopsis sp. MPI-PUGE-AT-0042]|nr:hypothetical protein BKA70DRAFT_1565095 [Coprinopsis sp. MPI-PUGE-AT-0042]